MPRNLSADERERIIVLHQEGLNISQIADALNVTRGTASRWVARYKSEGSLRDRERDRPMRVVKKSDINRMVQLRGISLRADQIVCGKIQLFHKNNTQIFEYERFRK
ncbi:unnamed protein product, partial [Iphiclides podalirius]